MPSRTEWVGVEGNSLRPVARLARTAPRVWSVISPKGERVAQASSLATAKWVAERWHKGQVKAMASAIQVRQCQRTPEEPQRP